MAKPHPSQTVTLDDHSKVVPLLPIPNRTVKRLRADDSGRTSVKVGHRQALILRTPLCTRREGFCLWGTGILHRSEHRVACVSRVAVRRTHLVPALRA